VEHAKHSNSQKLSRSSTYLNKFKMSSTQMTMRGLRDYPPEIRNGIYKAACAFDGKMPDLIKALRQDPELYKDAMHVFLKSNTYILHDKNGWTFGDMGAKTVASIQRLHLIVE
jgi:hypothetical protein